MGKKLGMTQVYAEDGVAFGVTAIEVLPQFVTQLRSLERDGYLAVQVGFGVQKSQRLTRAEQGHLAASKVEAVQGLTEFRLESLDGVPAVGEAVPFEGFEPGSKVNVRGISKGKGFAGTVKRHNFGMQDATHGNSVSHRVPGSIGQRQTPGRVFPGKKMAGHMGAENTCSLNLKVVKVDGDRRVLFVEGSVPGPTGGLVKVTRSHK